MTRTLSEIEAEISALSERMEAARAERAQAEKAKVLAALPPCEGKLLDMLAESIVYGADDFAEHVSALIGEWQVTIVAERIDD